MTMSEWVEFNAPLDTIQVISEADDDDDDDVCTRDTGSYDFPSVIVLCVMCDVAGGVA